MKAFFTIKDKAGNIPTEIDHCYLATSMLDASDLPTSIRAPNGLDYKIVYDNFHLPKPWASPFVKVIGSYQSFKTGERFVVIRNYRLPTPTAAAPSATIIAKD